MHAIYRELIMYQAPNIHYFMNYKELDAVGIIVSFVGTRKLILCVALFLLVTNSKW